MNDRFQISNKTRTKAPSLPYLAMKEFVLGKDYELSLVFVGDKRSRKLNNQYRQKDKAANILSFPLDEKSGEIFINLNKCKKTSVQFERNFQNFVAFLFIHGLTHLKGFEHGSKMENEEEFARKKFKI
jgi:probable rRNA maturation factor